MVKGRAGRCGWSRMRDGASRATARLGRRAGGCGGRSVAVSRASPERSAPLRPRGRLPTEDRWIKAYARPAIRARSSDTRRAKACVTRCARGAPATGGCPPRITGRALTLGAGDARRSSDWTKATGLRRASSRTSSGRGPQRGQLRGQARPCRVASWMPGQTMMEPSAASGLLAGLSNRVQPPAGLRGRCGAWPVCMVNA
jgi:hypothetical protein